MNPSVNPALSALRDIHLPMADPWWMLAWGWWMLLFLVVCALVLFWFYMPKLKKIFEKRRAKQALELSISNELKRLRDAYKHEANAQRLLVDISAFLRRVTRTLFTTEQAAGKIESEWLTFLDQQWGEEKPSVSFTSEHIADVLNHGAYRAALSESEVQYVETLLTLTESWVQAVLKRHV